MRIAFLSDIHGNATALEAVLRDVQQQQVDKICILGDLCFRGPEPKRTLDLIRSLNAKVLKGHSDEWLVRGINKGEIPEDQEEIVKQEIEWTLQRLDEDDIAYLRDLPTELIVEDRLDLNIHAFHATPSNLLDIILPDEKKQIEDIIMARDSADLYVYGHLHEPFIRSMHGKNIVNTGSVGMPFDGHPLASYLVVEVGEGRHRLHINRVPYNREHVVELYKQGRYPNIETMGRVIFYAVKP
ncbi:metallophosphoesterase family protein [bacterium LRH843]|nr:metallophosphoesterase family protein [bacterium LRH843]